CAREYYGSSLYAMDYW
nr:immunoglobulin heavy chain junction region [Mus musculus]